MFETNALSDPSGIQRNIDQRFARLWSDSDAHQDSHFYERNAEGDQERWGEGLWDKASPLFHPRVNSEHFLGPEFVNNPDIVALGCSVTAPVGMPFEFAWPNIVSKQTGKSVNALSFPGSGVQRIVRKLFAHINAYGEPKEILFLLPDFQRVQLFYWDTYHDKRVKHGHWQALNASYDQYDRNYKDPLGGQSGKTPRPLVFYDIFGRPFEIPVEVALSQCVTSLHILVDYCRSRNIELRMFSWHGRTQTGISNIEESQFIKFSSSLRLYGSCDEVHVPMFDQSDVLWFNDAPCHDALTELHEAFWLFGADEPNPHPGLHAHIHYAEAFLGEPIRQDTIRLLVPETTR